MSVHEEAGSGEQKPSSVQEIFYGCLDGLERRAHALGLTMTDLCRESKVSRATPDRWRKELPKTIQNLCALETVVVKHERKK